MTVAQIKAACKFKHPDTIAAYRDGWKEIWAMPLRSDTHEHMRVVVLGMLYNDVPPNEGLRVAGQYAIDLLEQQMHIA